MEDFKNVYDFEEAFVKPFAPAKPAVCETAGRNCQRQNPV